MKTKRCEFCNRDILKTQMLTRQGDPICPHCGYAPRDFKNVWLCEECGNITANHIGERRPTCDECGHSMVLVECEDYSTVRGIGTGEELLEIGLSLLMEAQV